MLKRYWMQKMLEVGEVEDGRLYFARVYVVH